MQVERASPTALFALLLAACATNPPNVGGNPITCTTTADCLSGETCDTNVSPAICVSASGSTGTTGGTGTTSGSTSGSPACVIGDAGFASGATNAADDCQVCNPSITATGWSNATNGTSCTSDGGTICQSGVCTYACFIGGSLVSPGSPASTNACSVCVPDAGATAYSNAPDLTPCAANGGNLCVAGSCVQGCAIDGGFVAQWAYQSPLQAACCNGSVSPTGWSPAFGGANGVMTADVPASIAVADFNLDGLDDFAVAVDTSLQVFLSDGDGGFSNVWSLSGVNLAGVVTSSDLSLEALSEQPSAQSVYLFAGDGGGQFVDAGFISSLTSVQNILSGNLASTPSSFDLAVSETSGGGQVSIYEVSNGAVTFVQAPPVTPSPGPMCAADFRTASVEDVAVLDTAGAGISILLNESNGTVFRATTPFNSPPSATALTSTQLPFSALPELAVTGDNGTTGLVELYVSLGDGGFNPSLYANVSRSPAAIVAFRRDGGSSDTLVTASGTKGTLDVLVAFDGGLVPSASYPSGTRANALATGDFNGDSITDLAVSDPSSGNVYILYGQCR